ncbi:MAG: TonB family protein [Vicinamibacterales bacterium]
MQWPVALRFAFVALVALQARPGAFFPAQYRSGALPAIQIQALGGGEVLLEATVDEAGSVTGVRVLRTTEPFTEPTAKTVGGWRFSPAQKEVEPVPPVPAGPKPRKPVASKVLVAAVFRPPTLNTPTYGDAVKNVAAASVETPFPTVTVQPQYPLAALYDGLVLVEVRVGVDGRVVGARVIQSAPPFDPLALEAARAWKFSPARVDDVFTETLAYITFGFRQPITR